MSRNRLLVIAAAVILFILAGAFVALRGTGGGGRSVTLSLEVKGSTMTPSDPSAHLGDTVTMTITADREEEIHIHGYDIPFQVPGAGRSVTKTFKADKSGAFPIEIEATGTTLGTLTVTASQ